MVRPLADGERQLSAFLQAEEARIGRLVGLAERLGLAVHGQAGLAMAFYDPQAGPTPSPQAQEVGPRIVVREEFYLDDDGALLSGPEMVVDVYEYLLHSVILAWFHLDLMPSAPPSEGAAASASSVERDPSAESHTPPEPSSVAPDYRDFVKQRAKELMADVPAEAREAQYVTGVASFGSHVLALYNEIARARDRSDGDGLCRLLAQEGGLFGLWRRDLQEASYSGYAVDHGPALEPVDQLRFLEAVLDQDWNGDPQHDLAGEVCAGSTAPAR